ncbi:hypothetical protein [Pseudomonas syringae group genomosp. 3]|nr:hypothetical protein [Pseudomonas syringae group genomosp. 3]
MIDIAPSNQAFKKRVIRFFSSVRRASVTNFISDLSSAGEVLVFGGLLRDIALFGTRNFNSDIDLVVDCSSERLRSFFMSCKYAFNQNKFGGYRLEVGGWSVDVWPIRETWAFNHAGIAYRGHDSLLLTTITNWDAVVFSFKEKKIISGEYYLDSLRLGELDIVLSDNPNSASVLMRVIKAVCDKRAKILMPRMLGYLKTELPKWTASQVLDAQEELLGRVYLSATEFYNFRDEVFSLEEDLFGSDVLVKGRNFSFVFYE